MNKILTRTYTRECAITVCFSIRSVDTSDDNFLADLLRMINIHSSTFDCSSTQQPLLLVCMRGAILTAVRVRPLNEEEIQRNCITTVDRDEHFIDGRLIIVDPVFYENKDVDRQPYERLFTVDHSFWSAPPPGDFANLDEVYAICGAPLIKHCMDGVNGAIMAYGETGSGKVKDAVSSPRCCDSSILLILLSY